MLPLVSQPSKTSIPNLVLDVKRDAGLVILSFWPSISQRFLFFFFFFSELSCEVRSLQLRSHHRSNMASKSVSRLCSTSWLMVELSVARIIRHGHPHWYSVWISKQIATGRWYIRMDPHHLTIYVDTHRISVLTSWEKCVRNTLMLTEYEKL